MWPLPDNEYVRALLASRGEDSEALRKEVDRAIWSARWRRALEPWRRLPRLLFQIIKKGFRDVRYRKARAKVYGGSNQASGGGAGGTHSGIATLIAGSGAFQGASSGGGTFQGPSSGGGAFQGPSGAGSSTITFTPAIFNIGPYASESPIEEAGIKAGEIVGYRCWCLVNGLLRSCYQTHVVWEPGKIMEGDPSLRNEGIHAFKDRLSMGAYGCVIDEACSIVSGTVYLWGEVVEHERGYRASKAALASIDDSPHYDAKALRKMYGLKNEE